MRKMVHVPVFLFLLVPLPVSADCEMNPYGPQVEARLSADRRALELRKDGGGCRIALDCTVRAAPKAIHYELATLAKGKVAPYASQMSALTFEFADGSRQSCRSAGVQALD